MVPSRHDLPDVKLVLPNFLVIGAMKAGTTSLWRYLDGHKDVFMARPKELHFFSGERVRGNTLDWYESCFQGARGSIAIGEASTSYSKHPSFPGTAERIGEALPNVRIIYLVRDPIERIKSQYMHNVATGIEDRSIDDAVLSTALPAHHNHRYIDYSRYATQVEQYLQIFPRKQVLIIVTEELRDDRPSTMRRVLQFLGVDPSSLPDEVRHEHYRTAERSELRPWAGRLKRTRVVGDLARTLPMPLKKIATRRIQTSVPDLSLRARKQVEDELRPDIERLRFLLGEEFNGWGIN